ncbi:MAG: head GIN domain-containing protein [Dysgonomonas sp.]|nr:head GIN domain-containing protein [Dysgonomonas sp.]
MKKSVLILLMCCIYLTGIYAQTSEQRNVGNFNGINVCCGIEVFLTEGKSSTIVVNANPDVLPKVKTEVNGNTLNIGFKNNISNIKGKVTIQVTAKDLIYLGVNSGSKIKGASAINAKDIKLQANSGAGITLDLKANNVTCESNSAGSINLIGSADLVKASNNSAASINMKDFVVTTADVSSNSGASIQISVKKEIKAHANSGGRIQYYGNPPKAQVSSNSGGSIQKK